MKDTAVKFLIDEISCRFVISEELRIAMYKAIEMEKQQLSDAYHHDRPNLCAYTEGTAFEEYYQENCKPEII
jgi:hypothetical protein